MACGGRLAQLVEHLTFNQVVTGSNPVAPTNFFPGMIHMIHKVIFLYSALHMGDVGHVNEVYQSLAYEVSPLKRVLWYAIMWHSVVL